MVRCKRGFSLIELSVVILIISILAAGAISLSGSFMINSKNKLTEQRLDAIYKAIGVFVAKKSRLPCPALLIKSKSDSGYAQESGSAVSPSIFRDCNIESGVYNSDLSNSKIVYGMVPVHSLGLSDQMAEDGFGSKFSYIVHESLTVPNYSDTVVALGDDGFSYYDEVESEMIKIYQSSSNSIPNVAFAIISHGQNKKGAYNANSTIQNSDPTDASYETFNIIQSALTITADFGVNSSVSNPDISSSVVTFVSSRSTSDDFDDKVFYKTRDQIIFDFDLNHLYFCDSSTAEYPGYDIGNAYGGQTVSSTTACDDNSTTSYPSVKCSPAGSGWVQYSCNII